MTYGEMKDLVELRLNRADVTDSLTSSFVNEGLQRVARDYRRVQMMETAASLEVLADGEVAVPTDFLKMREFWCGSVTVPTSDRLIYKPYGEWSRVVDDGGTPAVYTRIDASWYIKPAPAEGSFVTCLYYQDLPEFEDADEHAIFSIAQDLVLYASLCAAAEHYEDTRGQRWEAKYLMILQSAEDMAASIENEEGTLAVSPLYEEDY